MSASAGGDAKSKAAGTEPPAYMRRLVEEVCAVAEEREGVRGLTVSAEASAEVAKVMAVVAQTVTADLVHFAEHGGRLSVGVNDVLLLARRNPGLKKRLSEEVQRLEAAHPPAAKRGKKS
eukprot:Rhum_TRINITY_DN5153_c0_g1::Rhum_TRINITY_DN5153_c0_g1_i1::g.16604::m.16604/K11511/APITD1, CENPS, MHF1; centromere protein S